VQPPLPGPLAKGVAVVTFQTGALRVAPIYGPSAVSVVPKLGHLHVTVDDAPWHWVHASSEPLVVQGLAAGLHTLRLDLADPDHPMLASRSVRFDVPEGGGHH
jgi:hypothetical protein